MVRPLVIAIAVLALVTVLPGAEASCHFCLDNIQTYCVEEPDVGPCTESAVYVATHPVDFVEHLIHPD
jgi:hypothetical protein